MSKIFMLPSDKRPVLLGIDMSVLVTAIQFLVTFFGKL